MTELVSLQTSFIYVNVVFHIPLQRAFTYRAASGTVIGMRVRAELGRQKRIGIVIGIVEDVEMDEQDIKDVLECLDSQALFQPSYLELAKKIASLYFASLGECLFCMVPTAVVKREKKLVAQEDNTEDGWHELAPDQQHALNVLGDDAKSIVYVYGITGSGKTEIFLRAARQHLDQGKSVIYLVPEIALSYQLITAIRIRFQEKSAILHSSISKAERLGQWRAIMNGEIRLVIGTRSAIFAPLHDLGLIIIDEEHDNSYKSSQSPRYHARQVAMMRNHLEGARILLGSATPSMEAWQQMETGKIERIALKQRVAGGSIPKVELIDISQTDKMLSDRLIDAVHQTVHDGSQVMLFLNRRGFAHLFFCRSCQEPMRCIHCSVYMTFHKKSNKMLCHYCGYSTATRQSCEYCSSLDVGYVSFGTQKLEEELAQYFPTFRIARLDSDVARKQGNAAQIIADFQQHQYDILVGTQMISKGLNIPGVKLVGIVLADSALSIPDFRAAERTFSQIVQVSGRASRFSSGGLVLVQTLRCDHPALQCAATMNIEEFYKNELQVRRETAFPPYSRIIRLVCRASSKIKVQEAIAILGKRAREIFPADIRITGPSDCYIHTMAGKHRMHLVFSSAGVGLLHQYVRSLLKETEIQSSVYLEVDIDPLFIA